jgi:hypothetical protein
MRETIRRVLREELLKEQLHTFNGSFKKGIGIVDEKNFNNLKKLLVFEVYVGGKLAARIKCGDNKTFNVKVPTEMKVLGKVDCENNILTVGIDGDESLWKSGDSTELIIKLSKNSIEKLNKYRVSIKSLKPEKFVLKYPLSQLKINPKQDIEISGDLKKFKSTKNNTQKPKNTKEKEDKERLSKIGDVAKKVTKKVAQGVAKGTKAVAKGVAKGTKVVAKNVAKGIENTVDNVKDRVDDMKDKNRNNNPTPPQGRGSTTRNPNF